MKKYSKRINRSSYIISDQEDAENKRPGPSNSEKGTRRKTHTSSTPIDKDKNQNDHVPFSEMSELKHWYAPLGVVNETLDETIIMNGNRPEADHHSIFNTVAW